MIKISQSLTKQLCSVFISKCGPYLYISWIDCHRLHATPAAYWAALFSTLFNTLSHLTVMHTLKQQS